MPCRACKSSGCDSGCECWCHGQRGREDDSSPSQDYTPRFPEDDLIRAAGFAIAHRPKLRPAIWRSPHKTLMEHGAALEIAERIRGEREQRGAA